MLRLVHRVEDDVDVLAALQLLQQVLVHLKDSNQCQGTKDRARAVKQEDRVHIQLILIEGDGGQTESVACINLITMS